MLKSITRFIAREREILIRPLVAQIRIIRRQKLTLVVGNTRIDSRFLASPVSDSAVTVKLLIRLNLVVVPTVKSPHSVTLTHATRIPARMAASAHMVKLATPFAHAPPGLKGFTARRSVFIPFLYSAFEKSIQISRLKATASVVLASK